MRESLPIAERDVGLELRRGSSVFMDGTGDYHLRRRGKPGILATLILPFGVADELAAALDARPTLPAEQPWDHSGCDHPAGICSDDPSILPPGGSDA